MASKQTNGDCHVSDHRTVPPMGMTGKQFQEAACSAVDDIERYYTTLADRPVLHTVSPGYLRKLLPVEAPQEAQPWKDIESDIEKLILPGFTNWQSPRFMAFFPASSTYPAILGEMWSAALTVPAFNWICSPAVTELETIVLDWLAQILGLPETFQSQGTGGGVIQGTASEAIVTAMVAARERYVRRQIERQGLTDTEAIEDRESEIRSKLVALGSDQAHSSTQKGSIIAGTRYRSVVTAQSDDFAMTGAALRAKIQELTSRGLHPYYLTVSLGTTNTCAVDDFASIAQVAKDYPDVWIHCDAAYAGAALVLPAYHHYSQLLSTFVDSFDMNMHKWLLTNFDCSCMFVRKRTYLTKSLSIMPSYLKNEFTESGLVTDYRDWGIPLGRRFRALKLWFVLRTWGVQGLQNHIKYHISLGDFFADRIKSRSDLFRIIAPARFALTVFAVSPQAVNGAADGTEEASGEALLERVNELTKQVFTLVEEQKEFFLTPSVIGGIYAIRVVSANPLAEQKYVERVFDVLVEAAEQVLKQQS